MVREPLLWQFSASKGLLVVEIQKRLNRHFTAFKKPLAENWPPDLANFYRLIQSFHQGLAILFRIGWW